MRFEEQCRHGLTWLTVSDDVLTVPPCWADIAALDRPDVRAVVLDLSGARLVSSLFLSGCARLAGERASRGQKVVLLHLSERHKHLLDAIDPDRALVVADSEEEVMREFNAVVRDGDVQGTAEGVTSAEKQVLWRH